MKSFVFVAVLALLPVEAAAQSCQDKVQQSCINAVSKRTVKVAAAQGRESVSCVKGATGGKLTVAADDCLDLDPKRKVQKAKQKNLSDEALKCSSGKAPDFGYTSAAASNEVAVEQGIEWIYDLFDESLDDALSSGALHGRCQTRVVQRAQKFVDTVLNEYLRCKMPGIKKQSICSAAGLEGCLGTVRDDSRGKLQRVADLLSADVARECGGVDTSAAFPGHCAAAQDLAGCVERLAACRTCLMINGADGIDADCDVFDDGAANLSCPPLPPTPTPTPVPTSTPTSTATPTVVCGGVPQAVTVSPDPILVQYGSNASVTASAFPPSGQYRNWVVRDSDLDVQLSFLQQPTCPNQTECTALLNAPEASLPAPSTVLKVCGTAEAEVSFRCASSGQDVSDTARVEVGCANRSAADCVDFCAREEVQGQCGTPCGLSGFTPPPYKATTGSCWKMNVNGTDYCYWDHKSTNSPGLGSLCCPNRCYGGSFVVWGQGFGVYQCTVIERCDDNPEFAGSECVDVTGT